MPTVLELQQVQGYDVEAPWGHLGTVERAGPDGLVVRTSDGARLRIAVDAVRDVDGDAREVLVGGDVAAPRPALAVPAAVAVPAERPMWQVLAFALSGIVVLVCFEIGLAFSVAVAVTGQLPY